MRRNARLTLGCTRLAYAFSFTYRLPHLRTAGATRSERTGKPSLGQSVNSGAHHDCLPSHNDRIRHTILQMGCNYPASTPAHASRSRIVESYEPGSSQWMGATQTKCSQSRRTSHHQASWPWQPTRMSRPKAGKGGSISARRGAERKRLATGDADPTVL